MTDRPSTEPIVPHGTVAPAAQLSSGPPALYLAKAAFTHARSVRWMLRRPSSGPPGLRILFYHRVSDDRDELAVRPRRFADQMGLLADAGYTVIDVVQAAEMLAAGDVAPRTIGLSFDDGYRDVAEHALPVLELHGFRATVFLATEVTGGTARFAWYRRHPAMLGWDEVRDLDGGALGFEAHTRTHPNLVALGLDAASDEIAGGKRDLEAHLGRPSTVFCYPAGLYGPRELAIVREAGFSTAVTCEPGLNRPGADPFQLRRRQVDARDRLLDFRAKVGGGHDSPPPLRGRYRRRFAAPRPPAA